MSLTSQQRLCLMKKAESNPTLAFMEFIKFMEEQMKTMMETHMKEMERKLPEMALMKHVQTIKGEDGHSPTDDELLALIKPLIPNIPKVIHGKTPTDNELLTLIRPLIPKVKDGETPSDSRLLDLIKPLIPKIKDGKPGKDGSPDKPEDIAKKLNTLEEILDQKVIKGLSAYLNNIQKAIREKTGGKGGGGMGNIITQSTDLTSATTTITLSYDVASNGKAIWFNYQGQQQQYGVHFTISGKIITLLFTPADGTVADIIYIRT